MTATENILYKTDGGKDVFVHYLGDLCMKKMFRNPYREDTVASCHLHYSKGRYYFYDFGSSDWRGDCFWFVAKLFNLDTTIDFYEVLRIIDRDLSLGVFSTESVLPLSTKKMSVVKLSPSNGTTSLVPHLRFNDGFSVRELEYWGRYGITGSVLSHYHVQSIRHCQFVRSDGSTFSISSTVQNPVYGYLFNSGKGVKIYRPKGKVRFMYAGVLPHPYVFGYEQLPRHDRLVFITGGEKDVMTLVAHGYSAICLNSETASIPEDLIIELCSRFQRVAILYDCDDTGKRESEKWVREYGGLYPVGCLELPLSGSKWEKDVSDYFSLGHTRKEFDLLIN